MNITPNFWLPFLFSEKQVENDIVDKIDHDKAMEDEFPKEYILSSYAYSSPEINHQTYQRINELFKRCACQWYLNPLTSKFHICVQISHFYQCKKLKIIKSLLDIIPQQAQIELLKRNLIDFTNAGSKYIRSQSDKNDFEFYLNKRGYWDPIVELEDLYAYYVLDFAALRPIHKINPNEIRICFNCYWKNHSNYGPYFAEMENFHEVNVFEQGYGFLKESMTDPFRVGKYIFSGLFSIFNHSISKQTLFLKTNHAEANQERFERLKLFLPYFEIRDEVYEHFLSPELRRAIKKEYKTTDFPSEISDIVSGYAEENKNLETFYETSSEESLNVFVSLCLKKLSNKIEIEDKQKEECVKREGSAVLKRSAKKTSFCVIS